MAEVSASKPGAPGGPVQPGKQACGHCAAQNVAAVTITSEVVYLRCVDCGEVWSIPQRRKMLRSEDPPRF